MHQLSSVQLGITALLLILTAASLVSPFKAESKEPSAGDAAAIAVPPVPSSEYWPENLQRPESVASYDLRVRLEPEKRLLRGEGRIIWQNLSSQPVGELYFHLYWNAFKNENSSYLKETHGKGLRRRGGNSAEGQLGGMAFTSLQYEGSELINHLETVSPDDGNPDDETVARVPLPIPVLPLQSAVLTIAFEGSIPALQARAGVMGDFYLLAQFYPKLGVLEVPGLYPTDALRWNCHQYHALSEFYSDFGSYHVSLTLPASYIVGATGMQTAETKNQDGTVTHQFHQENVHDFTMVAWPEFLQRDKTLLLPGASSPVNVRLLISKEEIESAETIIAATEDALRFAATALFPYPYPQLTIVVPPKGASEAGGIEFATLVTVWGELHSEPNPAITRMTVIHEVVHQYWQGMIATNEFEDPWIDEGITTYLTAKAEESLHPESAFQPVIRPLLGIPITFEHPRIKGHDAMRFTVTEPPRSPLTTHSWGFQHPADYFSSCYGRTAVTFFTLERLLGQETLDRFLLEAGKRFAFRHPDSDELLSLLQEVTPQNLEPFIRQFIRGTETLDYAVTAISSWPAEEGQRAGGKASEMKREKQAASATPSPPPRLEQNAPSTWVQEERRAPGPLERPAPSSVVPEPEEEWDGSPLRLPVSEDFTVLDTQEEVRFESGVMVERLGTGQLPVTLNVVFSDGSSRTEHWDGLSRWHRFRYLGPKVVRAEVDPEQRLLLDANRLNNGYTVEGLSTAPWRLEAFILSFHQWFLALVSLFL